jgi:hypothetical protein
MKINFEEVRPPEVNELVLGAKRAIDSRINEIRDVCGIEIKDVMGSELFGLEVKLKPIVTLELHKLNRLDLALEHVVLDPAWALAFWTEARATAKRNLTTTTHLSELERELKLMGRAESQVDISQDRLVVSGNRIFWIYEDVSIPSGLDDYCARSERLDLELMSAPLLPYSLEHHRHVLFCTRCRARSPLLFDILDRLVDLDLKLFRARLQVLAATQDLAETRVDDLFRQMPDLRAQGRSAADVLGYRALNAANYLNDLIQLSHLVPEDDTKLHPWCALEKGKGHPRAGDFLRGLDRELLKSGYAAMLLTQIWDNQAFVILADFRIPTAGDLVPYAWVVPIEVTHELERWQALLLYEPPPPGLVLSNLIETVRTAASTAINSEPVTADASSTANDLLQQTHDMVWVSAQRIEQVARGLKPPEEEIRNILRDLLGPEVFNRLTPYSRQRMIDAERIFADGHISPYMSIWAIGVAFELQVMESILPLVEDSLPLLKKESRKRVKTLESIQNVLLLECPDNICQRFSRVGLDARQVGLAISSVRPVYNHYKHREVSPPLEKVREIREIWYGLRGVRGVFHAITGSMPKSTGTGGLKSGPS